MDQDLLPGDSRSIWLANGSEADRPSLDRFAHVDVAIIGGGIVGIATAYQLSTAGLKVVLLEARRILEGVTGHTTAKLTSQHGIRYRDLIGTFGKEKAQMYADAQEWAIRWVHEMAAAHDIACDLVTDAAHIYTSELKFFEEFDDEWEACQELGLPASLVEKPDLPYETVGALRFDGQARFHPLKFLRRLAQVAESLEVALFERSRVFEIEENGDSCRVETEHGPILADRVVLATHYPVHDSGGFVGRLSPFRSYAIAVDVEAADHLPAGMFLTADGEEPMRSLRRHLHGEREILIVGGVHHRVGEDEDMSKRYVEIEHWARLHFDVEKVLYRWSTQDLSTADRAPYVGRAPNRDRIYMATGFDGWGMTNGLAAGKMLSEAILGQESPWAPVFDPSRVGLKTVTKVVAEGVGSLSRLVGGKIKAPDEKSLEDLMPGEGGIVRLEGEKIAAFRDDAGELHLCSSVCTHMGCQVAWNSAERSWDCPCHGSRFGVDGEVLHAPAVKPLDKRAAPAEHNHGEAFVE
jgi:glycine/D-amino acid oxidase-like deaminating enzyme/nitrite reductase/ring-hydroxylating ferredoxin subunit